MTVAYRNIVGALGYRVGSDGSIWCCLKQTGGRGAGRRGWQPEGPWRRLTPYVDQHGYERIMISRLGRKAWLVHHLVLSTFIGSCPRGKQCRHLDGDRRNNRIDNLAWGTAKENGEDRVRHGTATQRECEQNHRAKLDESLVREIRHRSRDGESNVAIAAALGVTRQAVYMVVSGRSWKCVEQERAHG